MRLLLVEDSIALQQGIRRGFEQLGYAVDVRGDGAEGLSLAMNNPYDVVILDLSLPSLDGMQVLERLREAGSDVHVLVLTARDALDDRVKGLRHGADDYLVKPFAFEELAARADALGRRKYRQKATKIRVGELEIDTADHEARCGGTLIDLTRREYSLLELLAFRCGRAVTRIELEDHLYGTDALPSSNAVDSTVRHLRAKLHGAGVPDVVHTRRGVGYLLQAEE